jgi:hypothetical protein
MVLEVDGTMGGGQWQTGGLAELWHHVGHEQRSGRMLKMYFLGKGSRL